MANPTFADQLKDFLSVQEANKRTTEEIIKQRDLMNEVAKAAAKAKLPFDKITGDIGQSVRDLKLFEGTQRQLNRLATDHTTLEHNLVEQIKRQTINANQLRQLQILQSDPLKKAAALTKEIAEKDEDIRRRRLMGERISSAQVRAEKTAIRDKYKNLNDIVKLYENLTISGNKEINNTKKLIESDKNRIDKLTKLNKLQNVATEILGQMGDLGKHITDLKFPDWTDVIKKGVTNFLEYDKAAFALRKNLGLMRGDFNILEKNVKAVGIELQNLGVSFEQVAAATSAIANEFNMFVASSKELVSDISTMAAQLGISESESAKFMKTMASISKTTVASQKGMMGFAKEMANSAGVPLPAVMKDVADAGDDVRIFTGRSAENLIKGVVQARQMGTTLQNMANTAKKLLDFQSSIADEMEASVLLGRDVNFQQARNLAYRKDIVGANQEILRIAKQVDFDAMDPYQAEAFAKASGKSVQELQDMLQADKEISWIRQNGTIEQKAQLEKMEQMKRMRAEEAKDVGKMAEKRMREQANQERINVLQNQFNKLMSELAQPVMDALEPLMDFAIKTLPFILNGFKLLVQYSAVFSGFKFLMTLPRMANAFFGALKGGSSIFGAVGASFKSVFRAFGSVLKFVPSLGKLGSFLTPILKIAGPIGLIINIIQGAMSLFGSFKSAFDDFSKGNILSGVIKLLTAVPKMIIDITIGALYDMGRTVFKWFGIDLPDNLWSALKSVGDKLFNTILSPFKGAWDWISEIFIGKSPSTLGMGILEGLKSVGGMLLDVLTAPFRTAFNFISGLFGGPKLPKMSEVLFGTKEETGGGVNKGQDLGTIISEGNKQIVDRLDQLITLMVNGGIAVNIDGVKAYTLLARAQKERGMYGAV